MPRTFYNYTFLLVILTAHVACSSDVEAPRIICHNANCVEPANPVEDDTPEALNASLALVDAQDVPLIDGVEIDTFWFGEEDRCLFAHDLADPDSAQDASVAFDIISNHLQQRIENSKAITRQGKAFSIFIELKGHVGPAKSEKHSPEQLQKHADCAAQLGVDFAVHSTTHDYPLELVFTSFDASLLLELQSSTLYQDIAAQPNAVSKLGYLVGVPAPLDSQSKPLDSIPSELNIDMLSAHPHWTRHSTLHAAESLNWELSLWMFSAVPETYDAILTYNPHYITTSEANLLSGWLEEQK